jgi:hypothetical protein
MELLKKNICEARLYCLAMQWRTSAGFLLVMAKLQFEIIHPMALRISPSRSLSLTLQVLILSIGQL